MNRYTVETIDSYVRVLDKQERSVVRSWPITDKNVDRAVEIVQILNVVNDNAMQRQAKVDNAFNAVWKALESLGVNVSELGK